MRNYENIVSVSRRNVRYSYFKFKMSSLLYLEQEWVIDADWFFGFKETIISNLLRVAGLRIIQETAIVASFIAIK